MENDNIPFCKTNRRNIILQGFFVIIFKETHLLCKNNIFYMLLGLKQSMENLGISASTVSIIILDYVIDRLDVETNIEFRPTITGPLVILLSIELRFDGKTIKQHSTAVCCGKTF